MCERKPRQEPGAAVTIPAAALPHGTRQRRLSEVGEGRAAVLHQCTVQLLIKLSASITLKERWGAVQPSPARCPSPLPTDSV